MEQSDEITIKFHQTYEEEFKEKISLEEAQEKFLRLVNILRIITRPKSSKSSSFYSPPEENPDK